MKEKEKKNYTKYVKHSQSIIIKIIIRETQEIQQDDTNC